MRWVKLNRIHYTSLSTRQRLMIMYELSYILTAFYIYIPVLLTNLLHSTEDSSSPTRLGPQTPRRAGRFSTLPSAMTPMRGNWSPGPSPTSRKPKLWSYSSGSTPWVASVWRRRIRGCKWSLRVYRWGGRLGRACMGLVRGETRCWGGMIVLFGLVMRLGHSLGRG